MDKRFILSLMVIVGMGITAFAQNTDDFVYRVDSQNGVKSLVITGYKGQTKDVVVPASINNVPVKTIGESAFRLKGLTSVVLPEGLECISQHAFFGNKLSRVDIPASVKIIADAAFDSNLLLKINNGATVTLTAQSAGKSAQSGSNIYFIDEKLDASLVQTQKRDTPATNQMVIQKNVYEPLAPNNNRPVSQQKTTSQAPQNVAPTAQTTQTAQRTSSQYAQGTTQYQAPQNDRRQQEQMTPVKEQNPFETSGTQTKNVTNEVPAATMVDLEEERKISARTGVYVVGTNRDGLRTIAAYRGYDTAVAIPNKIGNAQISVIGKTAFVEKKLTYVDIPEGITFIDDCAFMSNNLTHVTIPSTVRYIGSQAFTGNQLQSITIDKDVVLSPDSFSYRFSDYYNMSGKKAGTYVFKAGQWDLNGIERVDYNVYTRGR
ncbi:MAG: leucine-rich repeat domain-containing protein [Spirochaetaceae bacterium]|jgi:hypothetical protein|nr:leucine-rich repeat domain-containing protein [Spirochaetaceae bacterium]